MAAAVDFGLNFYEALRVLESVVFRLDGNHAGTVRRSGGTAAGVV